MKTKRLMALLALPIMASCEMWGDGSDTGGDGKLDVSFSDTVLAGDTRSGFEIPDTNDFILTVTDSDGKVIYDGNYGEAPESMMVSSGSYNVKVVSCRFERPQFSMPQFGDEQCVVVPSGGSGRVKLLCTQQNSGIRLKTSPSFLSAYPDASLLLKSGNHSLSYGYRETRVAYFKSGDVSLVMSHGGTDDVLMTRWMEPNEVLTLKVDVSIDEATSVSGKEISVSLDTTRYWVTETYTIGESKSKGDSSNNPMGISQAKASVGAKGVWVTGYIVAGDLTASSASYDPPFKSASNLAIGPKKTVADRNSCMSVQLPSGDMRDVLNLVSHPGYLGKKLMLKGDIVASYFGLVGIKNITDYVLE